MPNFSDSPAASFKGRFSRRTVLIGAAVATMPAIECAGVEPSLADTTGSATERLTALAEQFSKDAKAIDPTIKRAMLGYHVDGERPLWSVCFDRDDFIQPNPDAALLKLGKEFERRWANERAVYAAVKGDHSEEADARCDAAAGLTGEIVDQIAGIPARTAEGHRLLARAYIWCRGENPDDKLVVVPTNGGHVYADHKIRAQLINSLLGHAS